MNRKMTGMYALFATAAIAACSLGSCKKDKSSGSSGGGSSSGLSSGQATIQFSTNASFGGKMEFKSNQTAQSKVVKGPQGSSTNISLVGIQMDGTKLGTAQLTLIIPKDATTASGSISGKFDEGDKGDSHAVLMIGSSDAGSNMQSYASSTGNFTITKLTDTEIEGTFDTYCENSTTKTNITLSNGKFAGKF